MHARIPEETVQQLDQIADSLGRSRNWVFNQAVKQYVATQQWQLDLIKKRLQEAKNPNTKFILHDTIMTRYEKKLKKKLGV